MTPQRAAWDWLAVAPQKTRALRVLQAAIGTMLLYRVFSELPFVAYFWGPHGVGHGSSRDLLGPIVGSLTDKIFATDAGALGIVGLLGLAALGLVAGWQTRLATVVALIAFVLLGIRLPELPDGGDTAARLLLLYLLFVLPRGATAKPGSPAVWFHNLGVLAIAMQIMMIYATSGLLKAAGQEWFQGTALYYIGQAESLTTPAVREVAKHAAVTTLGSYFTVLYEVLFPVAVLSPLRVPWVILGIGLHVGIALALGLVSFSIIMIGMDLFFITDPEYAKVAAWLRRGRRRAATRGQMQRGAGA
jgi:hypothetical protein